MSEQLWWYTARAGGIVAWALLSASLLWGASLSLRLFAGRPKPPWMLDMHRYLGGLSVAFTLVHVGALVADSTVHFGVSEILVPFASRWRPGAVAWGVIAFYLLVAVEATSLAMRRIPRAIWRVVHSLSVVLWVIGTLHALVAGTDARGAAMKVAALAVAATVLFLLVVRALSPREAVMRERKSARRPDRVDVHAAAARRRHDEPERVPADL